MVQLPITGLGSLASLLLLSRVDAFYVPGYSIKSYKEGEAIPLMVNKVYSDSTQLQYAYYDLPFVCPPSDHPKSIGGLLSGKNVPLNLGEVLRGDRIRTSDIELVMGKETHCKALCTRELNPEDLKRTKELIRDSYVTEWIVDNLPGATSFVSVDKTRKYYASGFKLGYSNVSPQTREPHYFLNNHHTIVIRWRKASGRAGDRGERVIVGFEVYPKSIGLDHRRDAEGCPIDLQHVEEGFELRIGANTTTETAPRYADQSPARMAKREDGEKAGTLSIPYTYSVYFREDNTIEWSHRWDLYFVNQEDGARIHWLAIINSLIICGMLTAIVMIIFARTITSDIKGYKDTIEGKPRGKRTKNDVPAGLLDQGGDANFEGDLSGGEEALEDVTGWKLLHSDVFRPPQYGYLLAPLVGSGMQLLFMAMGLVLLSALGFLNPSFRGGFISVGVGLFVFAGVFSGYFSARVFKSFDGKDYRKNAMVTALLFPGLTPRARQFHLDHWC
ncbi:hypothetical protein NQ176_g10766 [Zarea fungicola]|uniref:Uncharacterized protein n=1 Tax=Zarea fungicola TaxID=93591 RepID=A0ACC1MDP0_9HYPO|nr:hypothetical protein NQ176_g10766 [Lecanicillium fungicola]